MASKNNYYVTSPIGSDYEGVSEEAISSVEKDFVEKHQRVMAKCFDISVEELNRRNADIVKVLAKRR